MGYKAQEIYYQKLIEEQPNWIYAGIFVDEGSNSRAQFNAMISAVSAGEIDAIITKNISRFNRNMMDSISAIKELRHRKPPVGVFFEEEGFFTLRSNGNFILLLILTLAEMEAENKDNRAGSVFLNGGFRDEKG